MNSESRMFFNLRNIYNLITDYYLYNIKKTTYLKPLLACYLVNYDCNYGCSFCSRVAENTYNNPKEGKILRGKKCYKLLKILRDVTGSIYLSGGEPLLHPDILGIVKRSKEIGFKPISLNTNASLLHKHIDVLNYIDLLVVSLHTLNISKMNKILGVDNKVTQRAIKNIKKISSLQNQYKFKIILNCVIGSDRIDDVQNVISFCKENNIGFSVTPQMKPNENGCFVEDKLIGNKKYQQLINYIIKLKKENNVQVLVSNSYLKIIKNLNPYPHCIPFLLPCISPNGGLYYPCPERKLKICENIIEAGSYKKAFENARRKFPVNFNRCHLTNFKPGNVEPSLLIKQPVKFISKI